MNHYPSPRQVSETYENLYLELVQLRSAFEILKAENQQLKQQKQLTGFYEEGNIYVDGQNFTGPKK